jgi:hypothetical protein
MTARSAPPAATMPVASVPRDCHLNVDLFRDAEPRKKISHKPDTAGASRDRDGFGLEQDLFEGLDGAHVGLRSPRPHRHAEGYSRKIHVRSGGDPLRGDQLTEALPGEDHSFAGTPRASCAAIVCGPAPCDVAPCSPKPALGGDPGAGAELRMMMRLQQWRPFPSEPIGLLHHRENRRSSNRKAPSHSTSAHRQWAAQSRAARNRLCHWA